MRWIEIKEKVVELFHLIFDSETVHWKRQEEKLEQLKAENLVLEAEIAAKNAEINQRIKEGKWVIKGEPIEVLDVDAESDRVILRGTEIPLWRVVTLDEFIKLIEEENKTNEN